MPSSADAPGAGGREPDASATGGPSDDREGLLCPECFYDLRGGHWQRCPECGLDLSFIESGTSQIPWCDPGRNRFAAFWATVMLAMLRPRLLLREAYRPVSYARAQGFRWVCVLLAFLGVLGAAGVVQVYEPAIGEQIVANTDPWFVVVVAGSVLLALVFNSGVHTYLFHPKRLPVRQQNRAVALSYYACAPLALVPLVCVVLAVFLLGIPDGRDRRVFLVGRYYRDVMALLGSGAMTSLLAWWFWGLCREFHGRLVRGAGQHTIVFLFLPLVWLIIAGLCVAALPAAYVFLALVVASLG